MNFVKFIGVLSTMAFMACSAAYSADLKPWHENDLELYPRIDMLYQQYSRIQSSAHSECRHANDIFMTLGLSTSYYAWDGWIETTFANTHHRSFSFDNFRATGRYQWLSDVIGDPVSLITGLVLTGASKRAWHDVSSFHHGTFEVEMNVSIGKEVECMQDWVKRSWCVLGIGQANHGSPWFRCDFAWEKNYCEAGVLRLFLNSLWGCGNHSLHLHDFNGYGSVRHRSVDIGARLTHATECWGSFYLEYAHRVIASNFPAQANLLVINYTYPFGL